MDINARKKLSQLVDKITKTGELTLRPAYFQEIKGLAKLSDSNVQSLFEIIWKQMEKKHPQVNLNYEISIKQTSVHQSGPLPVPTSLQRIFLSLKRIPEIGGKRSSDFHECNDSMRRHKNSEATKALFLCTNSNCSHSNPPN
eukprot:TRINITY_DN1504_c0_g1_i3.p1 TRINITY_DN1504_c0_g1~~TRINITY_DN1504_c0_g1_i3.p1  ORF type:complete len:156 (-),score=21.41 TRINITY_DN1504_c0_g1_i3:181-606(-)